MTPIAWVVEHSLQASQRFRHLTVLPPVWTKKMLEDTERRGTEIWESINWKGAE